MSELGEKLKSLRKGRFLNQQDIADKFCVTRGTVSNWELGRRIPDIKTLEQLGIYYGVSMDFFVPTQTKDEIKDLLARADELFKSSEISSDDKTNLYNQLMKIYLNSQDI